LTYWFTRKIAYLCKKSKVMVVTYQLQINEATPLGQSIVALLQSANEAVVSIVKKHTKRRELTYEEVVNKSELHRSLDRAFADVRLMLDGKKPKKSAFQLLEELRQEELEELQA